MASTEVLSGGVLLSHNLPVAVPSALAGLTSGFGMGPGVLLALWPPDRGKSLSLYVVFALAKATGARQRLLHFKRRVRAPWPFEAVQRQQTRDARCVSYLLLYQRVVQVLYTVMCMLSG